MPLGKDVEEVQGANDRIEGSGQRKARDPKGENGALEDGAARQSQSERILTAQRDLGFRLASAASVADILRLCLDAAIQISGLDSGGIYTLDPTTGALHLACADGLSDWFSRHVCDVPVDSERVRKAVSDQPTYLEREALDAPDYEDLRREGITSVGVIPIRTENQLVGLLNMASHRIGCIPSESRNALESIATPIGFAILRAWDDAALRASEKRFRNLAEQSIVGIYLVQNGVFQYVNARCCEIFGHSDREMIGRPLSEVTFPDDWPMVRDHLEKISEKIESLHYESRIRKKDGELRLVAVYSSRTSYRGNPAVMGTLLDITDRRQAEDKLRKSEEKYRNLFENAVEGIYQAGPDGMLLNTNPALAEMGGYDSPREMIAAIQNLDTQVFVSSEDKHHLARLLCDAGAVNEYELQIRRKDGSIMWASINIRPVHDRHGNLAHYEGAVQDVTRRKLAEQALQESEAKYRSVVESSLVCFYIIQDGRFRYVNRQFCVAVGYSRDEIVDVMAPLDLVHPDDRPTVRENLEKRLAEPGKELQYTFRVRHKDGRAITIKDFGSSMEYNGRHAVFGTAIDITHEITIESQLRQAQKMESIGTLAGGIAHDFNNILGGMMGYTEIAQIQTADPRIKPHLEQILLACDRAKNLVNQILAFSRPKENEKKVLAITPIVREALKFIRSSLPATVAVRLGCEGHQDTVLADANQIHQALINLCTNAAHAMGERGGVLDVQLRRRDNPADLPEGPYLQLVVKDTGHGIDPATMEKIFDPFYTTKAPGEGTGLGLAMVYGIVKNHNGAISVTSRLGEGAAFTIHLPLVDCEARAPEQRKEKFPTGRERVLFVDDEELLTAVGKEMLSMLGYDVTIRSSSLDALATFRTQPDRFDLVITDKTMPNMTGDVLAGELLKLRPDLPVIMTSGFSDKMNKKEARKIGIREFIKKPISLDDLARTVRKVLDTP